MHLSHTLLPVRVAVLAAVVGTVVLIMPRVSEEYQRSRRLGVLAGSLVRQEFELLPSGVQELEVAHAQESWPNDFRVVRGWITLELLRDRNPSSALKNLKALRAGRWLAAGMEDSILHWEETLGSWITSDQRVVSLVASNNFNEVQLLEEARLRLFQGIGHAQVGRDFDATVLLLWSVERSRRFIENAPDHPKLSEGVHVLGEAYAYLRTALPTTVRSDRFQNLCSEFFPGSLWADRSRESRRQLEVAVRGAYL